MATPLTSPINKQATQYEVVAVLLNLQSSTVEFRVALLDADGKMVDTISMARGLAELGFTTAEVAAVQQKIVDFLKARGLLN